MRAQILSLVLAVLLSAPPARAADPNEELKKAGGAAVAGAAVGGGVFAAVGAGGLAVAGTAVTVGLAPFIAAGAVVGLAGYGIYRVVSDAVASPDMNNGPASDPQRSVPDPDRASTKK